MTTEIQEYSQTEAALTTLRDQYGDATYEVATTEGMDAAKAARKEVRGYRTGLENMRKQIKAPALATCKLIDSEAARITTELRKIEGPIDDQIKVHEAELERKRQEKIAAETKHVEDIQARIKSIRDVVQSVTYMGNPTSKAVQIKINDIEGIKIEGFEEFSDVAASTKSESLTKLREIFAAAIQREAEDERLAKEREKLATQKTEQEGRESEQRKRDKEAQNKIDAAAEKLATDQAAFKKEQEEAAEVERKAEEAKQAEIDKARKDKEEAEALAKRSEYPGDEAVVRALSVHFDVPTEVATAWLDQFRQAA
jgi:hypothetical protein